MTEGHATTRDHAEWWREMHPRVPSCGARDTNPRRAAQHARVPFVPRGIATGGGETSDSWRYQPMTTPTVPEAPLHAGERIPLTRRELAFVVAFWAGYASLSVVSRLFDRGPDLSNEVVGTVIIAAIEALCWILLTPPIFALAARVVTDRRRVVHLVLLAVVGVGVAVALAWLGSELRHALTPPRPRFGPRAFDGVPGGGRGRGPRGGGGPPILFGILNALVLYSGVVAAGIARAYSRRYHARREEAARREARLEAQLAESRLEALRRQLDPHFLFNTLNAVSALVERDPRGVRRMIARLSELLRHSFEGGGAPEVPLRDELALLARYVDIMQVRFQGRLTVETDADDDVLDALVPAMILQPLVENAIKHGVERASGAGRVVIEAEREGDELVLRVCDDGPGVPEVPNGGPRRGVGLRNTVARLEQLYGEAQRFTLAPGPLGGTVAEIRLPFHARTVSGDERVA